MRALPRPLHDLAVAHGVGLEHVDGLGVTHQADPEVVLAVLRALGTPIERAAQAGSLLEHRRRVEASTLVEPTLALEEFTSTTIPVRADAAGALIDCAIESDQGDRVEWRVRRDDLVDGRLPLPEPLRAGYHTCWLETDGRTHQTTLVVAPRRGARGRFSTDWRGFGVLAPIFRLRSHRPLGGGDLGDLDELASYVAARQGGVVATLPLLAGIGPEPFEPSPYLPLSREYWHERWIDLERVPELAYSASARAMISDPSLAGPHALRREDGTIDGATALRIRRDVLRELARAIAGTPGREAALRSFVLDRPHLVEYARFRAAMERFGPDWRQWPAAARDGLLRWSDVDPESEREHLYAQWILHEQLHDLAARSAARGQVLALDLPVGVDGRGFDVWRARGQFADGASIGAPPDAFFPAGQCWGLPPVVPDAVRADGHRRFRAAIAHHLAIAGLLRIDHVMGLQRLYWVPDGADAADGLYVAMPMEELFAVLAVEAQRHRADIVGEDLGTVDPALRDAMTRFGVRRSHVAQFAIAPGADDPVEPAPAGSVASFSTHDLPTAAGWITGRDLDERVALGHLDATTADAVRAERAAAVGALAPDTEGDDDLAVTVDRVLDVVHTALGRGDAGLVMVQLDDLVGELDAVNLPGTSTERPNWGRPATLDLDAILHDPAVDRRLRALAAVRGQEAVHATARRARAPETVFGVTRLHPGDLRSFAQGRHHRLYDRLGAHDTTVDGVNGTYFAVWAPNAERVRVVGDFNGWDGERHPLAPVGESGVWEGFVPGARPGHRYKLRIRSRLGGDDVDKADPFARATEIPPRTASVITAPRHEWTDGDWMRSRAERHRLDRPMSIYEVHLGSWRRVPEEGGRSLTYREAASRLAAHAHDLGFTHVELLPIMEHPFYGSWGYQTTGYFAPTARYGSPDDFAAFVDELHRNEIGVILDWVPSHFPSDAFALAEFDGTHLYEHADPRQRVHPDWQSWIFNYGRNEVRSFLISSACYWLDRFHIDGLRLDAVASMLYLDYSRGPGEWVPNRHGGNANLEAVELLQECNTEIYRSFPDVVTIAEESTAWSGVSRPVHAGGLGFGHKWDMGWMHDTLDYLGNDPIHRRWHHDTLTFRAVYAHTEHYVLPLSHDEVVHGKGSLLSRMPGDDWQQRANLRLLYGYQYTIPGKKLLFMGGEIGQRSEWDHESSVDWHLLDDARHAGIQAWVAALNHAYRDHAALHVDRPESFVWIDCDDRERSVLAYERRGRTDDELVVVVANFTPVPRPAHRIGVPRAGTWSVVLDGDDPRFGGSGFRTGPDRLVTAEVGAHDRHQSLVLDLPPLALVVLAFDGPATDPGSPAPRTRSTDR